MLTTIISSCIVSAICTVAIMLFYTGKYIEKIHFLEKIHEKHDVKICELSNILAKLEGGIDRDRALFIKRESPLNLTEPGKEVLNKSGGKNFIDLNQEKLIESIKNRVPKTAYDVQEISKLVITECTNIDEFNVIKNYLYASGLDIELMIEMLSLYLRDLALKELGFKVTDIHD